MFNSCLYICDVMHYRLKPRRHRLNTRIFMFYLDLDEIDSLAQKLKWFSRNRWNVFSFFDQDHLELGAKSIKDNILKYLQTFDLCNQVKRIRLLTNVRIFGYVFNPVSFYYCFDHDDQPLCVVAEIGNTFGELKPFLLDQGTFHDGVFDSQQVKHYYISPFVALDVPMHFQLKVPSDRLNIKIDDVKDNEKFLITTLTGTYCDLNNKTLWQCGWKFPFVTLKVISLIHLHAFILWLKKIPYFAKEDNPHLQKGVYRAWVKK